MGKNQRVVDRLARLISNAARPPGPCVRTFIRPNCASTSPPVGTAWSHAPRIAFPATWLHIPVPRRPARGADTRGPRRYVGFYKDVHGPPMTFACRSSSEKKMPLGRSEPVRVLLLRQPVPVHQGTDPYHHAFGTLRTSFRDPASPDTSGAASCAPKNDNSLTSPAHTTNESRPDPDLFANDDLYLVTHHMRPHELKDVEFRVVSFPILTHVTVHADELDQALLGMYHHTTHYDGVIMTSQKAVQAWQQACVRVYQKLYVQQDIHPERMRVLGQVPFYVVGPATAKALRHIEVATPFQPTTIHGAEAGNAESLALHMMRDMNQSRQPRRFLYLVGDKRSPALINTLQAHDAPVTLDELVVYATDKNPGFEDNCALLARDIPRHTSDEALSGSRPSSTQRQREHHGIVGHTQEEHLDAHTPPASAPTEVRPDWIVFFSPSGGNYALQELVQRRWIVSQEAHQGCKVACIGRTTAQWVHETLGFEPHAIAAHPTPDALQEAIFRDLI